MGDSAFRFANKLMKPYPFQVHPPEHEKICNYQLSKCRRVVENAFGHLKARFRRIGKGVDNHIKNVRLIIKAACTLHNFLNCHNDVINHKWIEEQITYESSVRLEQPEHTDAVADFEAEPEKIRRAIANSFYSGVVESPASSSLEMNWDWLLVGG
uniref:DDE Tnp4 domain-containing protein n=1 Tax=Bactrocera latifrons TaxID=174628 RepID=A0A0K8UAX3_BACLA